jgi:hypothetical protein
MSGDVVVLKQRLSPNEIEFEAKGRGVTTATVRYLISALVQGGVDFSNFRDIMYESAKPRFGESHVRFRATR